MSSSGRTKVAVVISTWTGNPSCSLFSLCDSIAQYPAGMEYDLVLSANGFDYAPPAALVPFFTKIFIRENIGFNLGAWDYAWRHLPDYDRFLFLQDDCYVLKMRWLHRFNRCFDSTSRCGLVGEHLARRYNRSWAELSDPKSTAFGSWDPVERCSEVTFFREKLACWGIPAGVEARTVSTVVQFTSRAILEDVDGYNIGLTKGEAGAAEIGFSRKIEARGYALMQVGRYRHSVIGHRQWPSNAPFARLKRSLLRRLSKQPPLGN